jgi:hypothetical protein
MEIENSIMKNKVKLAFFKQEECPSLKIAIDKIICVYDELDKYRQSSANQVLQEIEPAFSEFREKQRKLKKKVYIVLRKDGS